MINHINTLNIKLFSTETKFCETHLGTCNRQTFEKRWSCLRSAIWLLGQWDSSKSFFDDFTRHLVLLKMIMIPRSKIEQISKMLSTEEKRPGNMLDQNLKRSHLNESNTWHGWWKHFIKLDGTRNNFGLSMKITYSEKYFDKNIFESLVSEVIKNLIIRVVVVVFQLCHFSNYINKA